MLLTTAARAQCATQWSPGQALAGTDGEVNAVVEWDPDGVGPRTPVVVLGGWFTAAGDTLASRIVAFDPAAGTWSTLGAGFSHPTQFTFVRALAVLPNGDLVAGGRFASAGGVAAANIARWDGSSWSPLGAGVSGDVHALQVLPNGDLVVGGVFNTAGGIFAERIARWDGVAWSAFGSIPGFPNALTLLPNGDLIAGGAIPLLGSVARWNGSTWTSLGGGIPSGTVYSMTTLANGDLVVGGQYPPAGNCVHRWNGSTWSAVGASEFDRVSGLCTLANGDLVAAGWNSVQRWDGSTWSTLGNQGGTALAATRLGNGDLIVTGAFTAIDDTALANVAAWNGAAWSALGVAESPLFTSDARSLPNGDIVVSTLLIDEMPEGRVMRTNGAGWSRLGEDFDSIVNRLAIAANGDLIAGGLFTANGTTPALRIARWDGAAWSPLGGGLDGPVNTVLPLPNGDLVVGGEFASAGGAPANRIARWDGGTWSPIGAGMVSGVVHALTVAANGDLVAAGAMNPANVMRWDGVAWMPMGAINGTVLSLATMPNGDIIAGGVFGSPFGPAQPLSIARWDGSTWQPLGGGLTSNTFPGGYVTGLVPLPNGELVAAGRFTAAGGIPAAGVARWDGSAWSPLATSSTGFLRHATRAANGDILIAGISTMDGVMSAGFARLTTTCPATANTTGSGCAGNTLTATNLPWIGSTFAAEAGGLPANAIALDVFGLSTVAIPLSLLSPQGVPGCSLAVSPDVIVGLLPSGGTVATQLSIPNSPALAGAVVHEQVLALDLGTGGAIVAVTGTNRLTLTIGTF